MEKVVLKGLMVFVGEHEKFVGTLDPVIKINPDRILELHELRWVSKNSGFVIMDHNSKRIKDFNRFYVEVKDPITKMFE